MRAIFGLKSSNTTSSIHALEECLLTDESALVRHEAAYALGQTRNKSCIDTLIRVLRDLKEDVMVRHEAAEALGAIGCSSALSALKEYTGEDIAREIRETCELAIARIEWEGQTGGPSKTGGYGSVDPVGGVKQGDVSELEQVLCDEKRNIKERYEAMFGLRNLGGKEAVRALCKGLENEKLEEGSALFRHEICYVLGQMGNEESMECLERVLRRKGERDMVRHEAAEAIGAIGGDKGIKILKEFKEDEEEVVRESVEVALDVEEYVNGKELHYASTIGVEDR